MKMYAFAGASCKGRANNGESGLVWCISEGFVMLAVR